MTTETTPKAAAAEPQETQVVIPSAFLTVGRNATVAELQSAMATDIAAGNPLQPLIVNVPPPQLSEFPFVMYNAEKRIVKLAKDKKEKDDLIKEGFGEDPFPAEDPDAITPAEMQLLKSVLEKLGKAANKLEAGEPPSLQHKPAEKPPATMAKK